MKNIYRIKSCLKNPVVTVGTFDGVHLGHQEIMKVLVRKAIARKGVSVVVSYYPHPLEILENRIYPYLLTEKIKKEEYLKSIGIDYVLWLDFDKNLANVTPEEFIKEYFVDKISAKEIILGYDWHFGKDRKGDYHLLKKFEKIYNFKVDMVSKVKVDNQIVSSTKIREYLLQGNIFRAKKMLGKDYSILGKVIKGMQIGRKLGFPTSNIQPMEKRKLFPGSGVYLTKIKLKGKLLWSITNVGFKPTIQKNGRKKFIETNIFNFNHKIYSENIELFFKKRIRNEMKFDSIYLLKNQIKQDVQIAKSIIKKDYNE